MIPNQNSQSSPETAGRDEPQCGERSRHLLHSSTGGIHRDAPDKCKHIFFGKSDINCPNVQVPNCDNNDNHDNDGIDQVPNCDGKFLLRILTDEQSNIW